MKKEKEKEKETGAADRNLKGLTAAENKVLAFFSVRKIKQTVALRFKCQHGVEQDNLT